MRGLCYTEKGMRDIVKLNDAMLSRYNLAEYVNFMGRMHALTLSEGCEALGIEADPVERLAAYVEMLTDAIARNFAAPETAEMKAAHRQRVKAAQFIINTVRNAQNLPYADIAQAAQELMPVMMPVVRFYERPRSQVTALLDALLFDLHKEGVMAHIVTLNLSDTVAELTAANARYRALENQRTQTRLATEQPTAHELRTEVDALYDYITTLAFCHSVCHPSTATARYISRLNAIIEEAKTAHRKRRAKNVREKRLRMGCRMFKLYC